MSKQPKKHSPDYTLDQLKEGYEGPIVVMICRKWDVHTINGRYLSTDFVISDEKENVMHCTMRSNTSHCFIDKIQEGVIVCMRSFTVQKRDEYRIIKDNDHFIELNGSALVRKDGKQVGGFVRHPFQLMEFEKIQPTEKYLIDVIGFIVTVGKSAHPITGSKTLDFHLINERGRTLRVILWGKLGDQLLKMMSDHCGNYTIILTSMSAKYYNGQLGISSCSSTLILDSDEIPTIVEFKSKISDVDATEPSVPISESKPRNGTLQELLNMGRDRRKDATTLQCEAEIMHIRTKNSWYYPACGSGKCKKGVTHKDGQLWCDACDKPVSYPKKVDVRDETAETVVVIWEETATELTKTSAKVLLDGLTMLPHALMNLYNTKHVFEIKSHTYYNYGEFESFTCTKVFASNNSTVSELPDMTEVSDDDAPDSSSNTHKSLLKRLVRAPQVCTPSKASEQIKKEVRYMEEDSGAEDETVEANPVDRHAKEHEE
ncbi:hypothetical protein OROMI_023139 [Orobanche minor]